ncbi:hypothetical protein ACFOJG_08005 [Staphylococcus saprophyticus]|uniref:hypothetical protein n=1 Tax=Staphylococcus saprophyticus TaxID=29385 RepID=UPI003611F0BB
MKKNFNVRVKRIHYFNGISDSSYLNFAGDMSQMITYEKNTPNLMQRIRFHLRRFKEISAPTLLCGPIGKDAHKVSERLHKKSAFEELPFVLEKLIKSYI